MDVGTYGEVYIDGGKQTSPRMSEKQGVRDEWTTYFAEPRPASVG